MLPATPPRDQHGRPKQNKRPDDRAHAVHALIQQKGQPHSDHCQARESENVSDDVTQYFTPVNMPDNTTHDASERHRQTPELIQLETDNSQGVVQADNTGYTGPEDQHTIPDFMKVINYPHRPDECLARNAREDIAEQTDTVTDPDWEPQISDSPLSDGTSDTYQNANFDNYNNWPYPIMELDPTTASIYDRVRAAGAPNYKGARIPIPSPLIPEAWERESSGHPDDATLINGARYGFPIQYTGGPTYAPQPEHNHPSAEAYKEHVQKYFTEETMNNAMAGPFTKPPFTPWHRASPLMTRPKTEEGKRRVIVDLSFPNGGVNHFIHQHQFNGEQAIHTLPTIADLVDSIKAAQQGDTMLAVIDLSRAYRHFPVCPLDWPLLVLKFNDGYYFDKATPFGARMSSFIMETAAMFIIRALQRRGIRALMYLDDLILLTTPARADSDFEAAIQLLTSLGLRVAKNKLQPPARRVTWLGIIIDLPDNSISIPPKKLAEIQQSLAQASRQTTLTKKALQRVIGQINHLSKVVPPARLFMGRLLAALRGPPLDRIRVDRSMKADFSWFRRFLKDYNGRAIIPEKTSYREIWADACLEGGGATDGRHCYSYVFPEAIKNNHHITHLEAINCLAAARVLTTDQDRGNTVIVNCDNMAAVEAYRGGRARDHVLGACARAMWYLAARNQVIYQFNHVPGELMTIPDALSRVMLSQKFRDLADSFITDMALQPVTVGRADFMFSSFYF